MMPRRLATSATVPRARGEGALALVAEDCVAESPGAVPVAPETVAGGPETPVRLGVDFGGPAVTLRARGTTLGAAGLASTGRGRVRGGRIETWGRVSCLALGWTGSGVVAGVRFSCPALGGTGAGAVAGASGVGATWASAGPQAENRQVATIVELSHRDRWAPGGTRLVAKSHAARSFTQCKLRLPAVMIVEDMETPRVARPVARHRE